MSDKAKKQRKKLPRATETQILVECRRRCCLCHHLDHKLDSILQGQIAHIDHDRTNHKPSNLAYLCMPHHDTYDSVPSQSKGITPNELLSAKAELLRVLKANDTASQDMVSLTLTFNRRFSELSDAERKNVIDSLLPQLVQASKTPLPNATDGRTRFTVDATNQQAEDICKAFNNRETPEELVDVRLTRPASIKITFAEEFKAERNGVTNHQAIEAVNSHDQVMLFNGKQLVRSGEATCGIFTKRYSKRGQRYTTIVLTCHDKADETKIFSAVKACHDTVGNLDNSNPLQCLEAFLKVFGFPIALPQIPQSLYVLGETITLPPDFSTEDTAIHYLRRFVQCPVDATVGIIAWVSYSFPPIAKINLMYCLQRERYLSTIRNKGI